MIQWRVEKSKKMSTLAHVQSHKAGKRAKKIKAKVFETSLVVTD